MLLKFVCCFLSLIKTGWPANEYLFEQATAHHAQRYSISLQKQYQQKTAASVGGYEKNYFFFSAPEDDGDEREVLKHLLTSVKKRQKVIFIKAPTNDANEKALLTLLQNAAQQKTHIFVFTKDPDYASLKQKFQNHRKWLQNKPEVYFIKYRNALEVKRIQSAIIDQYGDASESKFIYSRFLATDNTPVRKDYAMNFLPMGVDVVPGSSYIPLFY